MKSITFAIFALILMVLYAIQAVVNGWSSKDLAPYFVGMVILLALMIAER